MNYEKYAIVLRIRVIVSSYSFVLTSRDIFEGNGRNGHNDDCNRIHDICLFDDVTPTSSDLSSDRRSPDRKQKNFKNKEIHKNGTRARDEFGRAL